jgi:hypothetical protein
MGQDAASVGQSNLNQLYLAIGSAYTPNWWFSGMSDDQLIAKGAALYAANPNIVQFSRDATNPTPPTFVVSNPGKGVEPPNAETPLSVTLNPDGSTKTAFGKSVGVVFNLPPKTS